MTEILLVSDGFFHPPFLARRAVRNVVTAVPAVQVTQIRTLNSLPGLDLRRFQGMVLYFHHKQAAPQALEALTQFVQAGGGLLAIHSATASFKGQQRYFEILGGEFTGHGPVAPFEIHPVANDAIFGGIKAFTVRDELYLHTLWSDIQVHFTARHEGELQPLVWTRLVGNGRVCYVGPGHRTATMQHPAMQKILRRGLRWAIGE